MAIYVTEANLPADKILTPDRPLSGAINEFTTVSRAALHQVESHAWLPRTKHESQADQAFETFLHTSDESKDA